MHYLIDGHNLIAKMPDISLRDPDDEMQLVLRLRSWVIRNKKRQVTLFFDGGIPGGKDVRLSTPQLQVIFASVGQTADALLIRAIDKVKNPPEFVLVTSDQQIIAAANGRKMRHIKSDAFAQQLAEKWQERPPGPTIADEPSLSEGEVAEWLALFGPVDEKALRNRPKPVPPNLPPPPAPEPEPADEPMPRVYNREEPQLSHKELEEWLGLFGGEPKPATKKEASGPRPLANGKSGKPSKGKGRNPHNLSADDLAAWHAFAHPDES